jgi:hypothetical protein
MELPVYELKIVEDLKDDAEVSFVALVDKPAIMKDFHVFAESFIEPSKGERKEPFLERCISYVINEGKESEQAVAICNSLWEQHFAGNNSLSIYGYNPTHFDMCPVAYKLFQHLVSMNVGIEEQGMIRSAAQIADSIFRIEKNVIDSNIVTTEQINEAVILLDDFIDLMGEIDKLIGMNHDVSFMNGHIEKIKSYLPKMKFESYTDYPKAASENAKIALRWAEENCWGECGTPVGKARANQLAKGEPISKDTIARMASFARHKENSQKELGDGCGRLMWLAWGGDAGVEWASRKLAQLNKTTMQGFSIQNEEQHIISGPLMLADTPIYRSNSKFGEHYVTFSPETIKDIAIKFSKKGYQKNVNLMHDANMQVEGLVMFESFIVDKARGILPMAGYEDAKDGSWFGSFYVENEQVWNLIKEGKVKGFSVEGYFDYAAPNKEESYAEKKLKELSELLKVPF